MQRPLPTFGVSEFTTWPWAFEEDVERYASLGVKAIEVCEFKLDWRDPGHMASQLGLIKERGLTISSVQPRLHSLFPDVPRPEPTEPSERMSLLRETIQRSAKAGCADGTTFVSIGGAAPDTNFREAYVIAAREYRSLAEFAADYGARIAFEPLNPILMNADTFCVTIPDALRLVDAVGHPSFGIWIDVWHIFQDAAARQHIADCAGRIFGVHVNDWHTPRCFGDRAVIGTGEIAPLLPGLLRAIADSGYDGAYTLELFSEDHLPDSLWRGDLNAVITSSRAAFEAAWREVGQ
jgi:sugar phosphate isomerase/epimerase